MPVIGSMVTFSPNTYIKSADVNANFAAIVAAFNASAVLTDLARTITVVHTFSQGATFSGGTVNFSGATVTNLTANLVGNVTGNVSGTAATVTAAAQPAITSVGIQSALSLHHLLAVGTTPALSNILANSAPVVVGGDSAMSVTFTVPSGGVTLGTRICTVTFATPYTTNIPLCWKSGIGATDSPATGPNNISLTAFDVYPAVNYSSGVAGNSYTTNYLFVGR